MNALLIYPKIPNTFWSFNYAVKFLKRKSAFPPLGLLTVAKMLPQNWTLKMVDMNVESLKKKDILWADIVFISAMTIQRESVLNVINLCKNFNKKTVAGGPLFTSEPFNFGEIDHLVLNEAEITLPQFLSDFERGEAKKIYSTDDFAEIENTPAPLHSILKLKKYASMSIQYSRGCPFNCDFCNVTALFGHTPRVKRAEQIITELDNLYNSGWRRSVFFVDDNFIGNKKHLKSELLPALIKWRNGKDGMHFFTEVSINVADDEELMELMVQAGFDTVFIGIETPDDGSLSECSKHQNIKRNLIEDVKKIHSFGLQVQAGFIVGFDSDTEKSFDKLYQFIQKSGIVTAMVGLLQAPYGTKLYERMKKLGRLKENLSGDNTNCTTNIISIMDSETLIRKYKKIVSELYSPKNYYNRVKTFLKDYKSQRKNEPKNLRFQIEQISAFFRSIIKIGILGKERFHYLRLLTWTFFHRPRYFSLAVSLAIYGYHFRKIAEINK
ncbi:MAG: B12-binding domain-containing radical SAM protein [Thermoanaerobaculaceae bacterium]|nr:B12-binding domain-containing radical SAM protein [Thermoanaerobaculaceae bacterium]